MAAKCCDEVLGIHKCRAYKGSAGSWLGWPRNVSPGGVRLPNPRAVDSRSFWKPARCWRSGTSGPASARQTSSETASNRLLRPRTAMVLELYEEWAQKYVY